MTRNIWMFYSWSQMMTHFDKVKAHDIVFVDEDNISYRNDDDWAKHLDVKARVQTSFKYKCDTCDTEFWINRRLHIPRCYPCRERTISELIGIEIPI